MQLAALIFSSAAWTAVASAAKVVSLVGTGWTLHNDALNISVPARLPSLVHVDLHTNQVIGEPLFGLNNFNLRWVVWQNWTYSSSPISDLSTDASSTWLQFDGLDTFASISFCGQHVAATNNQFRQYWFEITPLLRSCPESDRVLSINFGSAAKIANDIAGQPDAEVWPDNVQQMYQFDNRWFVRKQGSDFGWDWGPAFVPTGPWQPAAVVQLDDDQIHVRNTSVDIYRHGQLNNLAPDQTQPWVLNASLDYFGELPAGASMSYTLKGADNDTTISMGDLENLTITDSMITGSALIANDAVELWWPVRMGPQNLYYLTCRVLSGNHQVLATVTKRVGFRTIVVNGNPISDAQLAQGIAPGNNWHFEINGHEFYAKGSNFIPPEAFWTKVTYQRIENLFDTAIAGNQNMLRVWSTGAYAPDFMYDLADEKGLLLWSEFEFGCALYPANDEFLENVRNEAEYQVRRVNHHPSLAFWAGGNELENLELPLANDSAPESFPRIMGEYEALFLHTLLPAVYGNSRSISYQPSSTSNGWLQLNHSAPMPMIQRYNNLTEGSIYGESDYYNYDPSYLGNTSSYPVARFSNEFGFHSSSAVFAVLADADCGARPPFQLDHNHASQSTYNDTLNFLKSSARTTFLLQITDPPGSLNISNFANSSVGQYQMTNAVQQWLPVPNKSDSVANFSAWCHATQIFQAQFYTSQIEFYRRGSGLPERNLGSLYWQLEDLWVAPTWSSVEYDGRWKLLHYAAKDRYEPVIIAPYYNRTTGNLSVWVTSDLWQPIKGTAHLTWFDWAGEALDIEANKTVSFNIGAINSTQVLQTFTTDILAHHDPNNAILQMVVETEPCSLPNSNATSVFRHENWFTPTGLNRANLGDPCLTMHHSNGTFAVEATRGVAAFVWLDYPAGAVVHFTDNGFWMLPNQTRQIGYHVVSDTTQGRWVDGVTVSSVWNLTLSY